MKYFTKRNIAGWLILVKLIKAGRIPEEVERYALDEQSNFDEEGQQEVFDEDSEDHEEDDDDEGEDDDENEENQILTNEQINQHLEDGLDEDWDKEMLEKHDENRVNSLHTYKNEKLSDDHDFGTEDYDHDAILGETDSDIFENLSHEESTRRFNLIFTKMDSNKDDNLSRIELSNWIRYVTSKYRAVLGRFVSDFLVKKLTWHISRTVKSIFSTIFGSKN